MYESNYAGKYASHLPCSETHPPTPIFLTTKLPLEMLGIVHEKLCLSQINCIVSQ